MRPRLRRRPTARSSIESSRRWRSAAAISHRPCSTRSARSTLDPSDARALTLVGEIYEANKDWLKAAEAYGAANALEPGDTLAARADAMRERAAFETMPEEYRTIETAPTISRAQLAAVLAVHLEDLLRRARAGNAVVITDARDSWASPWIQSVTRAGVMDVFPNHTFQPTTLVRRADLASAVSHILTLIGTENPKRRHRMARPTPEVPGRGADAFELCCRGAIGVERRHGAARRWLVSAGAARHRRRSARGGRAARMRLRRDRHEGDGSQSAHDYRECC